MLLALVGFGLIAGVMMAVLARGKGKNREGVRTMRNQIVSIVSGVITLVIVMVLATTVNTQAAALGSAANIGDLIPLVYIASILMIGVALIGLGGAGFAGIGPLRSSGN